MAKKDAECGGPYFTNDADDVEDSIKEGVTTIRKMMSLMVFMILEVISLMMQMM